MNQVSEKIDIKDWYYSNFKNFEDSLNGHSKSYIHSLRKEAIEQFSKSGFPTQQNEEWKYTNTAPMLKYNFIPSVLSEKTTITKDDINRFLIKDLKVNLLVFINGFFHKELSQLQPGTENIKLGNLAAYEKDNPEFIEKYFNKFIRTHDGFTVLNTAFTIDGAVIDIPDGLVINDPVHLLFLSGEKENTVLSQPRNIIRIGKNSQVQIIESFHSLSEIPYLLNSVSEIILEENANLNMDRIQFESDKAFHVNRTQIHQQRHSTFSSHVITLGGSIVRNDLNSVLSGEGSECYFLGLYLADGQKHIDNHTLIDHASPHCHSNELYKGILDEKSRGVFNGKVIVRKDAQKTLAYQSNKNLLLSKYAKIDTKPQLEIFADDVKCSHGATVGQLDKDSLFYLRSRGVSKEKARSILIKAFASDVIDQMKNEQLRNTLNEQILERLHQVSI